MTWKEKRTITILSSILLILLATVVVVLGIRYQKSRTPGTDTPTDQPVLSDPTSYVALSYNNGSTTASFSLDETDIWRWDGNTKFPLDDTVIRSILTELTAWNPQQTLTDASALEGSGVKESTANLTATAADGSVTSLLFGKTTTDGKSYYVQLNEDEHTVYIIPDTLMKLMAVPVYDMCRLPQLPALEESMLQTITIQGPAKNKNPGLVTTLTAQRAEEESETTWRADGANVTDLPAVQALLEDVTHLTLSKCVSFNPSKKAVSICGFDHPTAALEIAYLSESGAERTLTLSVGTKAPDKSGRYVRVNDDTTIYLLATEQLDPLVNLAVHGLES